MNLQTTSNFRVLPPSELRRSGNPLTNDKYEQFAHLIAKGESPAKAYVLCGYSPNGALQSGNRLRRKPDVSARVEELKTAVSERQVEKMAVNRAGVVSMLIQNVQRAMRVEPVWDREGNPTGQHTYQGGVANKALELLGKELGMFQPKPDNKDQEMGGLRARLESGRARVEAWRKADAANAVAAAQTAEDGVPRRAPDWRDFLPPGWPNIKPPGTPIPILPPALPAAPNVRALHPGESRLSGRPLANRKYEHFAHLVAKGESPAKAYVLCGYSQNGSLQSGNRLRRRPDVAARVEELKTASSERQVEKTAVDRAWVVSMLLENAQRAIQLKPVRDPEGNSNGQHTYQGSVVNKALELMGKELGMFQPQPEFKGLPMAEIRARLNAGRDRVAAQKKANDAAKAAKAAAAAAPEKPQVAPAGTPVPAAGVAKPPRGPASAPTLDTLKQAATEEGQWREKREASSTVGISEIQQRLNPCFERVAAWKKAKDAAEAAKAAPAASRPPAAPAPGAAQEVPRPNRPVVPITRKVDPLPRRPGDPQW